MKSFLIIFGLILIFPFSSYSYYHDEDCKESVFIMINSEDKGGIIEVFYIDCTGKNQYRKLYKQSITICASSRYEVQLVVTPNEKYEFVGWGNPDIWWSGDMWLWPCQDLVLIPRFRKDPYYYDYDDDSGCFIQTLK